MDTEEFIKTMNAILGDEPDKENSGRQLPQSGLTLSKLIKGDSSSSGSGGGNEGGGSPTPQRREKLLRRRR